jgi:eukaryotic-like serine/threonine-protein kinase
MSLAAGTQLGPYEIQSAIGAGGMGEVYRARDTRLDRTVAIKVLPPDVVDDPAARERFVREGRAIAALNHPNICALYDVADEHGVTGAPAGSLLFLVMEYLEGETLADRLGRGALPVPQALAIATQIASALDKAHRAGIVHRDLKPGNVFLVGSKASAAPTVKLLDFGLAKAAARPGAASRQMTAATDLTTPGKIVGTVQYMAPEQVEGRDVDPRTDIFAFGVVLFEMLTGTKAFSGKSQASLTVAILEHDPPPVSALVRASPALDRAVRKCLAKDPDERWQSAADLASDLQWVARSSGAADAVRRPSSSMARAAVAVAAIVALAALAVAWFRGRPSGSAVVTTPKHFTVTLADRIIPTPFGSTLVLLPDGSGFVYERRTVGLARAGLGSWSLRTMSDGGSRALPLAAGGVNAFISPDGQWLGLFTDYRLRRIAIDGSSSADICETTPEDGGSWGSDGRIVFSRRDGLWRVAASGGEPERLTTLSAGETRHSHPEVLPGGDVVLFTAITQSGTMADATINAVSTRTRERRLLVRGATTARYVPTGHLVFARGSDVFAVGFDREGLAITGKEVLAIPDVQVVPQFLRAQYTIAADGTLAYLPSAGEPLKTLVWADKSGTHVPVPVAPRPYAHLALLPDQQAMVVEVEATPHNLWRLDFRSGAMMPLTHDSANHRAVLSPDGRFMVFSSDRTVPRSLFRQPTDGSGAAERLLEAPYPHNATSWSRDGRWLAFTESHPQRREDIWILALDGNRAARPFLTTPYNERAAVFSPDGHWIAYTSDESRQVEVLITAFPGPGPRKAVSTGGGDLPLFSADGRTLFYRRGGQILAAEIDTTPDLTIGASRVAFDLPDAEGSGNMPFPVGPRADRVLYTAAAGDASSPDTTVHVVVNWFEELRRLTAAP